MGSPAGSPTRTRSSSSLNIVLFVPTGATLRLLVPRVPWWAWAGVGFAVSGAIELLQWGFLHDRTPTWRDVAANTLGLGLGAGFVAAVQVAARGSHPRRPAHDAAA